MSDDTIQVLEETTVAGLQAGLRGELIRPGDEVYETARKVYNAMIDRHPRLIARCADAADVIAAVDFARENERALAIRRTSSPAGKEISPARGRQPGRRPDYRSYSDQRTRRTTQ